MKKFVLSFFILIAVFILCSSFTYADNSVRLYYKDKIYNLSSSIVSNHNEYFIEAAELEDILGITLRVDTSGKTVSIINNGSKSTYEINYIDYSIVSAENYPNHAPELINGKLYFPFEFIKQKFNIFIKYDKTAGSIYFFRSSTSTSFTNITNNYSLDLPVSVYIDLSGSIDSFDDSSVVLTDKDKTFTAVINCDALNSASLKNMRLLLNDYTSTDKEIFVRIAEYKKSYFRAMQDFYKNEFYFGGINETSAESNIKIFKDYNEALFGQDSNILLYNTIKTDRYSSNEETHINVSIPSYSNMTIYSINITGKKGFLNSRNLEILSNIVRNLSIKDHPKIENTLKLFLDSKTIDSANSGIYPNLANSNVIYKEYLNLEQNYKIVYPSTFIPYLNNSVVNVLDFKSFKIDYNNYFSVSVENIAASETAVKHKIDLLKSYHGEKINVTDEVNTLISGKNFLHLKYELQGGSGANYIESYFVVNDSKLYTIALNSKFVKPSKEILLEFVRIVKSIEFIKPALGKPDYTDSIKFTKFANEHEGYSFYYPTKWNITSSSKDINFDRFSIVNPDYSGPLDIYVNESEYLSNLSYEELLKYVTGKDASNYLNKYFKNYNPPYRDRTYKVLNSSLKVEKDAVYIYKLVNFLDEADRYKLCYSIDIIRNKKLYSLFISASDYLSLEGSLTDKELSYMVGFIAKSFTVEDTKEYLERKLNGERRNRKLVFIENCFKVILGDSSTITYARYLNSDDDVLIYIDKCREAGAYRIKLDYALKKVEVLSAVLQNAAVKSAENELARMYKDRIIHDIITDESSMTITVKYSNKNSTAVYVKNYFIEVIPTRSNYSINFIRKYSTSIIKSECQAFLESHLLTSVNVYFPNDYNYLSYSLNKYNYEKQYIQVFAKFNNISGYFVLEIDPTKDTINIASFTPVSEMEEMQQIKASGS
ncbi:MAG: stalk domain-containing protein [Bacillota bacterium]